jgi:hypothetical protein
MGARDPESSWLAEPLVAETFVKGRSPRLGVYRE